MMQVRHASTGTLRCAFSNNERLQSDKVTQELILSLIRIKVFTLEIPQAANCRKDPLWVSRSFPEKSLSLFAMKSCKKISE